MAEENKNRSKEEEVPEEQEDELSIPSELMEEIPAEVRPKIRKAFSMSLSMARGAFPMPHPLASKITSGHIDKVINNIEHDDVRQAEDQKFSRRYTFAGFVILVLVVVTLVVFLQLQGATDILINLIIAVFSLAGGFGIGRYFKRQ